jgi:hypothetical protein
VNKEEAAIVQELLDATNALHTLHGSTNIHGGPGSVGGAAMTAHCALNCSVMDARFDPETKTMIGDATRSIHHDELERHHDALLAVQNLIWGAK